MNQPPFKGPTQPTEPTLGDTMSTPEIDEAELKPLDQLLGYTFQKAFAPIVGGSYGTIREECDGDIKRMIALARDMGFGEKIDEREKLINEILTRRSIHLNIEELEADFYARQQADRDFLIASTHPDDVGNEGLGGPVKFTPAKKDEEVADPDTTPKAES